MHLSVATANLYHTPFEETLAVIADAGFDCIELDLYWQRKEWAMAQHLEGVSVKRAVQAIQQAGLKVTSIHDGGGVLEEPNSTRGYINPDLDRYLDHLGYAPDCLVFHTPHIEGDQSPAWWQRISVEIVAVLEQYRRICPLLTIENMPGIPGYTVPLLTPQNLRDFVGLNGLGVTLDTTHYAQMGQDIVDAAVTLSDRVRTIHLSDYTASRTHVFIGEGVLDLPAFFKKIDPNRLNAITIESSLSTDDRSDRQMSHNELVTRLSLAKKRLEVLI